MTDPHRAGWSVMSMNNRRWWADRMLTIFAVTLASVAGILLLSYAVHDVPVVTDAVPVAAPCDYGTELEHTVAELGDTVDNFRVTSFTNGYYGFVRFNEGYARLHPEIPCDRVADTVKHEWMHLQQVRFYGDRDAVYAHYGERKHFERVAACGQIMLGSDEASYLDPEHPLYSGPCTDTDMADAQALIEHTEH